MSILEISMPFNDLSIPLMPGKRYKPSNWTLISIEAFEEEIPGVEYISSIIEISLGKSFDILSILFTDRLDN